MGSFLAGGAGKTPFCIWLGKKLAENNSVAILCHSKAYDEIQLLKDKFQNFENVRILASANRFRTAAEIACEFDYILCDDGLEDSRISDAKIIRLDWDKPPTRIRDLIPAGPYRSLQQDHSRFQFAVECFGPKPAADFLISKIRNQGVPLDFSIKIFEDLKDCTVICGIGNPDRLEKDLKKIGIKPAKIVARPDHDKHFKAVIEANLKTGAKLVITEKDAARLPSDFQMHPQIFILEQKICLQSKVQQELMTFILGN